MVVLTLRQRIGLIVEIGLLIVALDVLYGRRAVGAFAHIHLRVALQVGVSVGEYAFRREHHFGLTHFMHHMLLLVRWHGPLR